MRLNKFLSHHGVCSRREADTYIEMGRVRVNNTVITTPYIVQENDLVFVDGKKIEKKPTPKIWSFYKPSGLVTTHHDPQNRPTVFEHATLQKLGHIISVGRLDLNSEGLLLLTNSPSFAHYAESPKTGWKRTYRVRVFGDIDYKKLDQLQKGTIIDGIQYQPIHVEYDVKTTKNQWIIMTLIEGKNREIRKIMNHFGLQVNRLIRTNYGPFSLKTLQPGMLQEENYSQKLFI